jgi:hypothetical protein
LHTKQEVILIFNQEDDDTLVQSILLRGHCMGRVGKHARLEDSSQILCRHAILISLGGKDGQQVQDVKKKLSV